MYCLALMALHAETATLPGSPYAFEISGKSDLTFAPLTMPRLHFASHPGSIQNSGFLRPSATAIIHATPPFNRDSGIPVGDEVATERYVDLDPSSKPRTLACYSILWSCRL